MDLSLGIPFFRSKYIGWLALESLCRQEDIDFSWELIVFEDNTEEYMGEDAVRSYLPRLEKVGCKRFLYKALPKWQPLSVKLKQLINEFSDSEISIWNPDDYYAPSNLLFNAYTSLTSNDFFDRYIIPKTIFYNIKDGKTILYDVLHKSSRRVDDSTGRAFKTEILKKSISYYDNRRSGCDGMTSVAYEKVLKRKPNYFFDETDIWKGGLNTKGLNNISTLPPVHTQIFFAFFKPC
jgi:hypothetical protein